MKFLRYKSDIRSLIFILIATAFYFWCLTLNFSKLNWLNILMLLTAGSILTFCVAIINHNHRHHSIFQNHYLNRLTDFVITFCIGAPSARLHIIHHFNHHRHFQDEKDWTNPNLRAKGQGLHRIFHYVISASKEISKNRNRVKAPAALLKAQRVERFILYSLIAGMLFLNPQMLILLVAPCWFTGLGILLISNLFNHDGCDLQSEHNHSRNFTCTTENWFFFNNGFHSAHHQKPHLHWSLLPEYHRQNLKEKVHADLQTKSFFQFFMTYVFTSFSSKTRLN